MLTSSGRSGTPNADRMGRPSSEPMLFVEPGESSSSLTVRPWRQASLLDLMVLLGERCSLPPVANGG
jgi:hypothetical protein